MAVPAESRRRMRAPTTGACDTLSNTTPVRVWARAGSTSAKSSVVIRIERSTSLIHRNQKGGAFDFGVSNSCSVQSGSPHRSEEHTSELQSLAYLVCRLLL